MAGQEDPVQREIHQDWANREYIEVITSSIKKIADFLNSFGQRASRGSLPASFVTRYHSRSHFALRVRLSECNHSRVAALFRGCVCVFVFGMTLILNISLLLPDMSCRSRLATLNEKLTALERRIEYIEARVSMSGKVTKGETLT
ncbi:hypothetical protein GH733_003187 [Mirounga leonina]|nr:hypothetical protein GH733_003187 [Mirounga leonina]